MVWQIYRSENHKTRSEFILYYHLTIVKLVARLLFLFYFFLSGQVSCPTDALACSEIQSFGNLTPDPWALINLLQVCQPEISAQVYTNSITAKPIAMARIFKAISHGGNTSQPFLIISFSGVPYIIILFLISFAIDTQSF